MPNFQQPSLRLQVGSDLESLSRNDKQIKQWTDSLPLPAYNTLKLGTNFTVPAGPAFTAITGWTGLKYNVRGRNDSVTAHLHTAVNTLTAGWAAVYLVLGARASGGAYAPITEPPGLYLWQKESAASATISCTITFHARPEYQDFCVMTFGTAAGAQLLGNVSWIEWHWYE